MPEAVIQRLENMIKAVLPHQKELIDKLGDAACYELVEELEGKLLTELQEMLKGKETDEESVKCSAEINDLVNKVNETNAQNKAENENLKQ